MSWVKLDDGFYDHEKVAALSAGAGWLWVRALAWSAKHLRDGVIPRHIAEWLSAGRSDMLAAELVEAGLWEAVPSGWRAHDFTRYNPSAEAVRAKREAARNRMARARGQPHGATVRANIERTSREHNANETRTARERSANADARPADVGVFASPLPSPPLPPRSPSEGEAEAPSVSPRAGTSERPGSPKGDELVWAMRETSDGKLCAVASAGEMALLEKVAREASPPITLDDCRLLGRAYRAGAIFGFFKRAPTLGTLLRNDGDHLTGGVSEAKEWSAGTRTAASFKAAARAKSARNLPAEKPLDPHVVKSARLGLGRAALESTAVEEEVQK